MDNAQLQPIAAPLLAWYDSGARVLPWRSEPTPYRVWVSEVMLQQTRVEAALPYFNRFMAALPTISALADAPEEQLLKLWEGLGYYSRVRNLQKAARLVMAEYGGQLPRDPAELQKLPGIGDYSAGAIASIAYNQRAPAVDGNVLRVVSRLLASRASVSEPKVKRALRQQVAEAIPPQRPGDFNQALMELGALVCLPGGNPQCPRCPLQALCQGHRQNIAGELPVKAAKKARKVVPRTVFALCSGGRLLLHKRPEGGLLSALWELPGCDGELTLEQARRALCEAGFPPEHIALLGRHTHVFSHVEWPMVCYQALCPDCPPPEGCVWATPDELEQTYALPSAFRPFVASLPLA